MPFAFRPAVHSHVLGARKRLQVAWIVPLQPGDICDGQARRQVRVFSVGLLPSAPAGVTKDVDVRGPECDAMKALATIHPDGLIIFGACLG